MPRYAVEGVNVWYRNLRFIAVESQKIISVWRTTHNCPIGARTTTRWSVPSRACSITFQVRAGEYLMQCSRTEVVIHHPRLLRYSVRCFGYVIYSVLTSNIIAALHPPEKLHILLQKKVAVTWINYAGENHAVDGRTDQMSSKSVAASSGLFLLHTATRALHLVTSSQRIQYNGSNSLFWWKIDCLVWFPL